MPVRIVTKDHDQECRDDHIKNDRRNSGGTLRQKFNHIDFRHLTFNQWTNGPRDQWTNGPLDQWTNEPLVQWNNGPINDLDDLEDQGCGI